jgi:hypothetical protein
MPYFDKRARNKAAIRKTKKSGGAWYLNGYKKYSMVWYGVNSSGL